jgi:hypothetical protein
MNARRSPQETAAHQYADAGWPVMPCRPGSKEPATGHGLHDASTEHRQIERWWSADPGRNVAIATGAPGPDVVDVDNHGERGNGYAALNRLKRAGLADGYHAVVQTPSRGIHLYFRGTGQRNGTIRGQHVDFRSTGGYVVAPPSATPAGLYVVAKHSPAAEAGTVSWDRIRAHLDPQPQAPTRSAERAAGDGTSLDRLVEWTARREAGDRNFPLFWAAKQAHITGQLDGEAVERFVDAARRNGLEGGEREARRTIASAQRAGDREARPFAHRPAAMRALEAEPGMGAWNAGPATPVPQARHQAEAV